MRWALCDCGTGDFERIPRAWWMRVLFPRRRLFLCRKCGSSLFVRRYAVIERGDSAHRMQQRRRQALRLATAMAAAVLLLAAAGLLAWQWMDSGVAGMGGTASTRTPSTAPCHRVHLYKAGETLESIAASELGADWRAQDIWVLNRQLLDRLMLENRGLEPGQALELPAPCTRG